MSSTGEIYAAFESAVFKASNEFKAEIYAGRFRSNSLTLGHRTREATFQKVTGILVLNHRQRSHFPSLLVVDSASHSIALIKDDYVELYAGTGVSGGMDGPRHTASFDNPGAISCDAKGNIYVIESSTKALRKISIDGLVSTIYFEGSISAIAPFGPSAPSSLIVLFREEPMFRKIDGETEKMEPMFGNWTGQGQLEKDPNTIPILLPATLAYSPSSNMAFSYCLFAQRGFKLTPSSENATFWLQDLDRAFHSVFSPSGDLWISSSAHGLQVFRSATTPHSPIYEALPFEFCKFTNSSPLMKHHELRIELGSEKLEINTAIVQLLAPGLVDCDISKLIAPLKPEVAKLFIATIHGLDDAFDGLKVHMSGSGRLSKEFLCDYLSLLHPIFCARFRDLPAQKSGLDATIGSSLESESDEIPKPPLSLYDSYLNLLRCVICAMTVKDQVEFYVMLKSTNLLEMKAQNGLSNVDDSTLALITHFFLDSIGTLSTTKASPLLSEYIYLIPNPSIVKAINGDINRRLGQMQYSTMDPSYDEIYLRMLKAGARETTPCRLLEQALAHLWHCTIAPQFASPDPSPLNHDLIPSSFENTIWDMPDLPAPNFEISFCTTSSSPSSKQTTTIYKVHDWLLASRWKFFEFMMDSGMDEAHSSRMTLPFGFPLHAFLKYLYTSECDSPMSKEVANAILQLGAEFRWMDFESKEALSNFGPFVSVAKSVVKAN